MKSSLFQSGRVLQLMLDSHKCYILQSINFIVYLLVWICLMFPHIQFQGICLWQEQHTSETDFLFCPMNFIFININPTTDNVQFNHLIKVLCTRLLYFFLCNYYFVRSCLRLCTYLFIHQTFQSSFIYSFLFRWAHGFLTYLDNQSLLLSIFILMFILSQVWTVGAPQTNFWVLLTYLYHSLNIFLLSYIYHIYIYISRPFGIFPAPVL